jgi:hypothetical protein
MRSYCSLYVDAGYLMAAASTRVTGTSLRSATEMDVAGLLAALTQQVERDSGLPLLRIHWYDSGTRSGGPGGNQRDIATLAKVKIRLGRVGFNGEQKGVDLKLALDLITQSRNRAAEIVYLVSGDDDLSEAVEEAQYLGVQVIGLVVPDVQGEAIAVSKHLHMTVDQMQLIEPATVDLYVKRSASAAIKEVAAASVAKEPTVAEPVGVSAVARVPSPLTLAHARHKPLPPVTPTVVPVYSTSTGMANTQVAEVAPAEEIEDVVDKVVINWWRGASRVSRDELMSGKPLIPAELDRALLNDLSNRVAEYEIPQEWRFALRDAFWAKVGRL